MGCEIVNGDAFCVYRGMDIGTAKPSATDREAVVHHLIDTHEVSEPLDVVWYQQHARAAIDDVVARDRVALLVGGSGLYIQAVLDDLRFPGTDAQVRARLEAELAQSGPEEMHRRLQAVDPAAAAQILATNGRRIVRALEVNEITGGPFTATLGPARPWCHSLRMGWDPGIEPWTRPSPHRVEHMWAEGLVAEVDRLLPQLRAGRTARARWATGRSSTPSLPDRTRTPPGNPQCGHEAPRAAPTHVVPARPVRACGRNPRRRRGDPWHSRVMTQERIAFTKGHGTGNDFVLLGDPHDDLRVYPGRRPGGLRPALRHRRGRVDPGGSGSGRLVHGLPQR